MTMNSSPFPRILVFTALPLLAAVVAVSGCKPKSAEASADSSAEAAPIAVQSAAVSEVEVPAILRLTGTLRGDRETDLAANAVGRVLSTSVERGEQIKPGQVLAKLDVRAASLSAAEARAQAESARAQEDTAKKECERYEQLKAKGVVSDLEYDRATAQCRTLPLSAEAASARANLAAQNVGDGVVRAPFAGVVTERYVEVGQYVRQDSRVVTIVSADPLRLQFAVPESEVAKVEQGAAVSFRVAAYPNRTFTAQVRFVSGALRASTRDLIVEALVPNPDRALKPGMFADLELAVGKRKLPAIPKQAVTYHDNKAHAFFVIDGRLEERVIALGPEAGAFVSVQDGARPGERVALGQNLTNGARVR